MAQKNFRELSRDDHVNFTNQWLQPLIHARDILLHQTGRAGRIPAQLDFHLLMPILFESAGKGSKDVLADVREWIPLILDRQQDIGFEFFITGPTFLEFLDQLEHQSETCREVITNTLGRIDEGLDPLDENTYVKSAKLQTWLGMLTNKGFDRAVTAPINAFERLLTSGQVHGIGDLSYVPNRSTAARYKIRCDELYMKQTEFRLRHDRQKRRESDSRFHYKVDAANICVSLMMQEEVNRSLYLFTRTQFAYREAKELARSDRALPALHNLLDLEEKHSDRIALIEDMIRYGSRNLKFLENYSTVANFPRFVVRRLEEFAFRRVPLLLTPQNATPTTLDNESVEEIRQVLSDSAKLRDKMDKAVEEIRKGGQHLVDVAAGRVNIDIWEDFDLSDDPVYQKIRRDFF